VSPSQAKLRFGARIGIGGFGEVYHGHFESPSGVEHQVAIKLLGAALDPRSQGRQRLLDEGRMLAALQHPSIVRVHDLVHVGDRVALVAEYIPGVDLDHVLSWDGPPPSKRAILEVIGLVADALHAARETEVDGRALELVHRDVKPSNIRLTPWGTVKLLDFGIAKTTDPSRESKTQTNIMLGSLSYLAPEVQSFQVSNGGPEADVYALGCTLYKTLTRESMSHQVPRNRMAGICSSRERFDTFIRRRLKLLPVETPPAVRELLVRLLTYDPTRRPTADELRHRAVAIADTLPGERLLTWARGVPWPTAPPDEPGHLTGRVVPWRPLNAMTPAKPVGPLPEMPARRDYRPRPRPSDASAGTVWVEPGGSPPSLPPPRPPAPLGTRDAPTTEEVPTVLTDDRDTEDVPRPDQVQTVRRPMVTMVPRTPPPPPPVTEAPPGMSGWMALAGAVGLLAISLGAFYLTWVAVFGA
jgi:serine/threonine protein kinase